MNLSRIIIPIVLVILCTTIFIGLRAISPNQSIYIIECFFSFLISSTILLGVLLKKNQIKWKIKNLKTILVLMFIIGVIMLSYYGYFIKEFLWPKQPAVGTTLTLVIALISLGLIIKIKQDLDNNSP